jgi:5-methylcytosine-specific restriction endonuclease McrA
MGAFCEEHPECRNIRAVVLVEGAECWMCLGPADTLDHIIPLNRGGLHCLVQNDVLPACRSCNSWRGDRPIVEMP